MENLIQAECERIADKLNERPRKRHNFYTPAEKFLDQLELTFVALHS
jgi:IS30 family transposase